MVGPVKKAPGGYAPFLVPVDKLTKWIEAWLITKKRSEEVGEFFLDIQHRFRVPNLIITDNGT